MHKKTLLFGLLLLVAVVWCTNVYAGDGSGAVQGFFNSVGQFIHNIMPWNWGK